MSRTTRFILMCLVFAALGWYVWHARDVLGKTLLHFDLRYSLPMLVVPLASLAVNGMIGRDLAAEFGVKLTFLEWYGLATVNALGNYFPVPQAGAIARGVYLKKIHDLPYGAYAASLVVTYVSAFALAGVLGLMGLGVLALLGRWIPWLLWLIFAALAAPGLLFTPFGRKLPLPGRLHGFAQGLQQLRHHHLLRRIMLLQTMLVILTATGHYLACQALPGGADVSWPIGMMLGLMAMTSGINVTPGNIGVEQGATELTAQLLHLPRGLGFSASALFRAFAVVTVLALGPFFGAYLTRRRPVEKKQVEPAAGGAVDRST